MGARGTGYGLALLLAAVGPSCSDKSSSGTPGTEHGETAAGNSGNGTASGVSGGSSGAAGGGPAASADITSSTGSGGGQATTQGGSTGGSTSSGAGGDSSGAGGAAGASGDPSLPPPLTWLRETTQGVNEEVWASGPDDIYAVGRTGGIYHSTGDGTWTSQLGDTAANLTGVWGTGPDNVFISGLVNVVFQSAGDGMWTRQVQESGLELWNVHGSSATNAWVATGGAVRQLSESGVLGPSISIGGTYGTRAIWAIGETELWAVNPYGAVVHYDSATDERNYKQLGELAEYQFEDVWATSATNAFAVGRDAIFHTTDGENWVNEFPAGASTDLVTAIHGVNEDNVFACTQGGKFYRSNGHGEWSEPQEFNEDPNLVIDCLGLWAISPDNVYLGVSGGVFHGTAQ